MTENMNYYSPTTTGTPCPHCGYCPTCGRAHGQQYIPYVPWYPDWTYRPWETPYITWGHGTDTNTGITYTISTTV